MAQSDAQNTVRIATVTMAGHAQTLLHMLPLHSRVSASELASAIKLDAGSIQAGYVLQTANRWLALIPISGFLHSPDRVSASLNRPVWESRPWWKKLGAAGTRRWPPEGWTVAAEVETGSWVWLGNASCHSWSLGNKGGPQAGDLVLESRLPRDLFLQLRNGDPWFDCGGGVEREGSFDTPASQRLQSLLKQARGDVFLQRWEGDVFGLQFDERRSVFFVMPEGMNSMTYRYATCAGAAFPPETDTDRIEMHCPCCGIEIGAFFCELHMHREFGFFVLSWLLEHHELPRSWPELSSPIIEWPETDVLSGV